VNDLGGTLGRRSGTLIGRRHGRKLKEWVRCGTESWMVGITNALFGFILLVWVNIQIGTGDSVPQGRGRPRRAQTRYQAGGYVVRVVNLI